MLTYNRSIAASFYMVLICHVYAVVGSRHLQSSCCTNRFIRTQRRPTYILGCMYICVLLAITPVVNKDYYMLRVFGVLMPTSKAEHSTAHNGVDREGVALHGDRVLLEAFRNSKRP